jgi:hypothetical protein
MGALALMSEAVAFVRGVRVSGDGATISRDIEFTLKSGLGGVTTISLPSVSGPDEIVSAIEAVVQEYALATGAPAIPDGGVVLWPPVTAVAPRTALNGSIVVTVPVGLDHVETLSAPGVRPTDDILIRQDAKAYTDDDENAPEMLSVTSLSAVAGDGEITVTMEFGEPTSGPIKLKWRAV